MAWRDCYTAASLLCVAAEASAAPTSISASNSSATAPAPASAGLAGADPHAPAAKGDATETAEDHSEAAEECPLSQASPTPHVASKPGSDRWGADVAAPAAAASAMRQLDMAALMGGPLLRPVVDAAVGRLQEAAIAAAEHALHVGRYAGLVAGCFHTLPLPHLHPPPPSPSLSGAEKRRLAATLTPSRPPPPLLCCACRARGFVHAVCGGGGGGAVTHFQVRSGLGST